MSPDSTQYLATARSVASGDAPMTVWWLGRPEPLAHFPPVYPLVIAFITRLGLSAPQAAWLVQLVLAPTNVILTAWCASRIAGGTSAQRRRLGMVAALATAASTTVLIVHSMAWSEPLFISLLLGAMLCLGDAVDSAQSRRAPSAPAALALSGILMGVATITRYAGVAFVGGATLLILIQKRYTVRDRVVRATLFATLSVMPLVCWLLYNEARGTTGTNREIAFHPVPPREWAEIAKPIGRWFVPSLDARPFQLIALVLCAVLLLALLVTSGRFGMGRGPRQHVAGSRASADSEWRAPSASLAMICAVLPACYLAFLIVSKTFLDRAIDLDDRLLSPILPPIIALVTSTVALRLRRPPALTRGSWNGVRSTVLVSVALYFVSQALGSIRYWRRVHETGVGVKAEARNAPALIQLSRALPRGARMYSNLPYVIFGVTGRMVRGLPLRASSTSLRPNPRFEQDVMEIGGGTRDPTYVLYFGSGDDTGVITVKELQRRFPRARTHAVPGGLFVEMSAGSVDRAAGGDVASSPSQSGSGVEARKQGD